MPERTARQAYYSAFYRPFASRERPFLLQDWKHRISKLLRLIGQANDHDYMYCKKGTVKNPKIKATAD